MGVINKRNANQMIVDYILEQILSGNLRKGDKLMTEAEFSERLGVSRIPLREALCALGTVGILESRQGQGTYVTAKSDPSVLGRMLYAYSVLNNVDLRQILDVRIILEPEAARQAAIQSSQRQKEELWALSEEYSRAAESFSGGEDENKQIIELDRQIHQGVAKASGNDFLWMLFAVADTSFTELNNKNYIIADDHGVKDRLLFAKQHSELAQAILDGNGQAAFKAMTQHLQSLKKAHLASANYD